MACCLPTCAQGPSVSVTEVLLRVLWVLGERREGGRVLPALLPYLLMIEGSVVVGSPQYLLLGVAIYASLSGIVQSPWLLCICGT